MQRLIRITHPKLQARWPAVLVWFCAWLLLWLLDGVLNLGNLALLLILASALGGVWLSAGWSVLCGAVSVLMFNWFFVDPRYTFRVHLHQDLMLLLTMMGVSAVVSYVMARLRVVAELERQQAQAAEQLRELSEQLRESTDVKEQGRYVQKVLAQYSGCEVSLMLLDSHGAHPQWVGDVPIADVQGMWACVKQLSALGPGTGRHEDQTTLFLPLRGRARAFGAVALLGYGLKGSSPHQRDHLKLMCDVFGIELERTHAFRLAQQANEEANQQSLRNTLLTSISHDYRTPLANLMGAASAIHDQAVRLSTDKVRALAKTVLDEAHHLNRMTNNTLQLARLDAAPLQINKDWQSLQEILGSVMVKARQRHDRRRFQLNVPDGLPLVHCDAILLVQLLDNLIDNAIQNSPEDTEVEVRVRKLDTALQVQVMDQGVGIAPEWKERVFQAFERVQPHPARNTAGDATPLRRGVGVGLAVCRAIAKVHHAQLWAEDRQPKGTVMCFELPLMQQPPLVIED
jgi:two-component system, OmpR family, sensor histidine kinase KdpD